MITTHFVPCSKEVPCQAVNAVPLTTGTACRYADALDAESRTARDSGGMHFGFSTWAGTELGRRVAQWVGANHFGSR